ncbi:alanine-zipper protein [Listeria monocytogenes]
MSQTLNIKEADPETSQKIDEASQDATDAKQKADNAKQSADQAQETANQANTAAQNALTSANGKNKNYYGIMEPVAPQEGDRWFKSVNGEEVQTFIYSSGNWTPIKLAPENLGTIYAEDGVIGSLDAGVITVGMLSANRIGVGDFTNLLPNPNFSNNLDRWEVNSTNTAYTAKAIATNNGYGIELAKTGSDLTQVSVWTNEYIPVVPGDKFYVSYFINQTAGISFNGINNMGVYAIRYKSDLTRMPGEGMLLTRNPNAGFLEGIYTVPADVYFLKIQLYHGTSVTNDTTAKTAISLTNIIIRKVTKGTMIEDGTISTDKLNVSSISAISTDFGSMTAGSIDLGNGKFKVDPEGNLTAKNANLTNGTFSTDYTIPVIGGNPPVYATGKMGVGNGGINATDTFTQGGKNYTRETALDGNGLSISIREGNNPASSIILDAVNSGLYFSSKASGISFAGSGTSNGTDIDTYGNIRAQSSARTWSVIDADRTNAFSVPMSSRHEQYGYILTPRHIKAGNMVLSKDHSISSLDGGMIYFNNTPGGTRVDIACKSVQQSSLLSMKENIRTINLEDALQAIIDTDVRQYNFKGESNTHTSFIIDDINDEKQYYADPHFLSATGDGRDDGNIVGYLMLAVKKLKQEIDALQAS